LGLGINYGNKSSKEMQGLLKLFLYIYNVKHVGHVKCFLCAKQREYYKNANVLLQWSDHVGHLCPSLYVRHAALDYTTVVELDHKALEILIGGSFS